MFLGIEIGGTKLQLGLGEGDGTITAHWRGKIVPAKGADGIRDQILRAVPELLEKGGVERSALRGVGVGFGGPVDDRTRTIIKSHQIEGWNHFPLANWIEDLLGVPVALGNDADVAGLAEASFGAGRGCSPVFYITIGSGIGGGLIINGKIHRGVGLGAAEIGHLRMTLPDGSVDILEHITSGWGLGRRVRAELSREPARSEFAPLLRLAGGTIDNLDAKILAEAARANDPFALRFLRNSWGYLAEAICHVIALTCPERIVIGGGVSLMGEATLFAPLREEVRKRCFLPFQKCFTIIPASLGESVVVHGALVLAKNSV